MAELFQGVKYIYLPFPLICLFGLSCQQLFYFDKLIVLKCNIMQIIYHLKQNKLSYVFIYLHIKFIHVYESGADQEIIYKRSLK